jgi:iron complex transport system ATP-binding protein
MPSTDMTLNSTGPGNGSGNIPITADSREKVFSLTHTSARYGETVVLRNISLEIEKGEFVAIIGPNGAGKSTLLKCMSGEIHPYDGETHLHGLPVHRYGERALARARAVSSPVHGDLPSFTVREQLMQRRFPYLSFFDQPSADDLAAVEHALDLTDTSRLADRLISTLSTGEFQLASIAAALTQNRDILLLDEPTSHLDPSHAQTIASLLSSLHEEGLTIITVLHELNMALSLATRIIALKEGSIFFDGSIDQFVGMKIADTLYGISTFLSPHPNGKPYLMYIKR